MEISREDIIEHMKRYFKAVHGLDYFYRAPETFNNAVERWMLGVMADNQDFAQAQIEAIEKHFVK